MNEGVLDAVRASAVFSMSVGISNRFQCRNPSSTARRGVRCNTYWFRSEQPRNERSFRLGGCYLEAYKDGEGGEGGGQVSEAGVELGV